MVFSRRPLTAHVRDAIRGLIASEHLESGAQLPSEVDLAARLGVARTTVREAFKALEQDGLVTTVHGRGRFVSPLGDLAVERPITRFESVTEMFKQLNHTVVNRVLDVRVRTATAEEARVLQVPEVTPVIQLDRLRQHQDDPVIYSINILAARLLPLPVTEIDWSGSVTTLLSSHGNEITSSMAQIRAATLPEAASVWPELAGHVAWLLITEVCVTQAGRPVLLSHDYHRSDIFSFHVLRRRGEVAGMTGAFSRLMEMNLKA